MKKNSIKAFTLTEMLIVIVIIGILIAALLPRMQAAQGRARDVSRKTALSQIQSAIVVYQGDHGKWPGIDDGATGGMAVSDIASGLLQAGMTSVPVDPLKSEGWYGLGTYSGNDDGDYAYLVMQRNSVENGGFALMSKVEVPGSANRVVCGTDSNGTGVLKNDRDISTVELCANVVESGGCGKCEYSSDDQLRYLITY